MSVVLITTNRGWAEQFKQLEGRVVVPNYVQAKAACNRGNEPQSAIIYDGTEQVLGERRISSLLQDAPLIVWQADRSQTAEQFYLQAGANHYCHGDVSVELMLLYIKLVGNRAAVSLESMSDTAGHSKWPWLHVDVTRHVVRLGKRLVTNLSKSEFLLFQSLFERPGQVKNRDQLLDVVYDQQVYVDERTIDSRIKRLRAKLRDATGEADAGNIIETLYGLGYRGKPEAVEHLFTERAQLTVVHNH